MIFHRFGILMERVLALAQMKKIQFYLGSICTTPFTNLPLPPIKASLCPIEIINLHYNYSILWNSLPPPLAVGQPNTNSNWKKKFYNLIFTTLHKALYLSLLFFPFFLFSFFAVVAASFVCFVCLFVKLFLSF